MDVMGLTSMQGSNSRRFSPPHTFDAHVFSNYEDSRVQKCRCLRGLVYPAERLFVKMGIHVTFWQESQTWNEPPLDM
jgi:hypothetical protein